MIETSVNRGATTPVNVEPAADEPDDELENQRIREPLGKQINNEGLWIRYQIQTFFRPFGSASNL